MNKKKEIRENILFLWQQGEKERTIRIQGTSMRPLIEEGNSITFRPLSNDNYLKLGDIAVFQGQSGLIAHRIVAKIRKNDKMWFKEKGDNRFYPSVIPNEVIVGKVISIDKNGVKIDLAKNYWSIINRFLGLYWRVLFTGLEFIPSPKNKFLDSIPYQSVGNAYRRCLHFLIKLPTRLFRSKQL